jgi:23S rRNA (cytosine1962-C5)-methyltransferase
MSESGTVAQLPALRLKRNEDRRLHAGHLWVFSNEVDTGQTPLPKFKAGELARVLAHNDRALGLAYVNPKSLISARMLGTWKVPDTAWFARRMRIALALRERLYAEPYYRLVYGESDGLPGLVVDRYGSQCVVQIGTAGMELFKAAIQAAVIEVTGCDALLFKNDGGARELEGLDGYVEVAEGHFGDHGTVIEDGLEFAVPLLAGQKTGWFFDQSANRRALAKYVRKGDRVLDVFSYVGGWGVRAARAGAADVVCVDSSAPALEMAVHNGHRNGATIAVRQGDAFDVLTALAREGARFEVVIIDPPAFAKRRKDLPKALAAYKRLNQLALSLLSGDGILVSCSCSHHVSAEDLRDAIAKAARAGNRHLQKAYFCRVTDGLE